MSAAQVPCAGCGYDLTGCPPGPCPECGKIVPPRPYGPRWALVLLRCYVLGGGLATATYIFHWMAPDILNIQRYSFPIPNPNYLSPTSAFLAWRDVESPLTVLTVTTALAGWVVLGIVDIAGVVGVWSVLRKWPEWTVAAWVVTFVSLFALVVRPSLFGA